MLKNILFELTEIWNFLSRHKLKLKNLWFIMTLKKINKVCYNLKSNVCLLFLSIYIINTIYLLINILAHERHYWCYFHTQNLEYLAMFAFYFPFVSVHLLLITSVNTYLYEFFRITILVLFCYTTICLWCTRPMKHQYIYIWKRTNSNVVNNISQK